MYYTFDYHDKFSSVDIINYAIITHPPYMMVFELFNIGRENQHTLLIL